MVDTTTDKSVKEALHLLGLSAMTPCCSAEADGPLPDAASRVAVDPPAAYLPA